MCWKKGSLKEWEGLAFVSSSEEGDQKEVTLYCSPNCSCCSESRGYSGDRTHKHIKKDFNASYPIRI